MADYISTLTGVQMDAALIDMAAHNSEAWAVGERNGIPVGSDDVTYQNNARYYAQIASSQIVGDASSAVRWDTDQSEVLTDAQKAQARENINAASDSDVVKITAQTLTTAQQAQARANIMAGGSNPNLLDNAYFVGGGSQLGDGIFPVNQRGQTSYTGGGTTFDRWRLSSGGSMTLAPEGVSVNGLMYQKKVLDLTVGDTYTLSRRNTDGTIVSVTGIVPSAEGWAVGNQNLGVYFRPSTKVCDIQIWGEYFLQAIKLEKGSVSTLANDVPPNFGEELAKCQRYLWLETFPGNTQLGSGIALTADQAVVSVITPAPMRSAQNITFTANCLLVGNGQVLTVSAVTGINQYDNIARLILSSSGLTAYHTYSFFTTTETTMTIYAEP